MNPFDDSPGDARAVTTWIEHVFDYDADAFEAVLLLRALKASVAAAHERGERARADRRLRAP